MIEDWHRVCKSACSQVTKSEVVAVEKDSPKLSSRSKKISGQASEREREGSVEKMGRRERGQGGERESKRERRPRETE